MSAKSDNPSWKQYCMEQDNPGSVKTQSRRILLVKGWDDIKLGVMKECLQSKFCISRMIEMLVSTGNQNIQEGNWHGDKFWGVCLKSSPNFGENHLGRLLMELRSFHNSRKPITANTYCLSLT